MRPDTKDETVERAVRLGTATLHEAAGKIGALPSAIKPVWDAPAFGGPALTVRGPAADNLWLHRGLLEAEPGQVMVVTVDGHHEAGYWGEVMAVAAQARGLAGLVIDGCVRDVSALRELGFPVCARGLCIRGTDKDPNGDGAVHGSLRIGDVDIHAGDLVVADGDGVVVLPNELVEHTVTAGQEREAEEARILTALRGGENTVELLDLPKETE